jgi:response regulator NasT
MAQRESSPHQTGTARAACATARGVSNMAQPLLDAHPLIRKRPFRGLREADGKRMMLQAARSESRRVLLIAQDDARAAVVERVLAHAGHLLVGHARSVQALLEQVARLQANLVIADLDAANAEALQQFGRLSERAPCPIVVFTGDENTQAIRAAVEAGVSSYVVDGFAPARIDPILQVAVARHEKEWAMRAERDEAQAKLAERKVIERAKGILMRKRGIGEDEAYHMLRRLAMDQSLRMRDVAERVISMSDLLG